MAEPWPVIPPLHGGTSWAVDGDGESWTYFDTEAEARRYAALPGLIETIRSGCRNGVQCVFCGVHASDGMNTHESFCSGIAALKATEVDP